MNNLTRTICFRLISIILINAFLCLDISWAAGGNLKGLHTHLAPPLEVNDPLFAENIMLYKKISDAYTWAEGHVGVSYIKDKFEFDACEKRFANDGSIVLFVTTGAAGKQRSYVISKKNNQLNIREIPEIPCPDDETVERIPPVLKEIDFLSLLGLARDLQSEITTYGKIDIKGASPRIVLTVPRDMEVFRLNTNSVFNNIAFLPGLKVLFERGIKIILEYSYRKGIHYWIDAIRLPAHAIMMMFFAPESIKIDNESLRFGISTQNYWNVSTPDRSRYTQPIPENSNIEIHVGRRLLPADIINNENKNYNRFIRLRADLSTVPSPEEWEEFLASKISFYITAPRHGMIRIWTNDDTALTEKEKNILVAAKAVYRKPVQYWDTNKSTQDWDSAENYIKMMKEKEANLNNFDETQRLAIIKALAEQFGVYSVSAVLQIIENLLNEHQNITPQSLGQLVEVIKWWGGEFVLILANYLTTLFNKNKHTEIERIVLRVDSLGLAFYGALLASIKDNELLAVIQNIHNKRILDIRQYNTKIQRLRERLEFFPTDGLKKIKTEGKGDGYKLRIAWWHQDRMIDNTKYAIAGNTILLRNEANSKELIIDILRKEVTFRENDIIWIGNVEYKIVKEDDKIFLSDKENKHDLRKDRNGNIIIDLRALIKTNRAVREFYQESNAGKSVTLNSHPLINGLFLLLIAPFILEVISNITGIPVSVNLGHLPIHAILGLSLIMTFPLYIQPQIQFIPNVWELVKKAVTGAKSAMLIIIDYIEFTIINSLARHEGLLYPVVHFVAARPDALAFFIWKGLAWGFSLLCLLGSTGVRSTRNSALEIDLSFLVKTYLLLDEDTYHEALKDAIDNIIESAHENGQIIEQLIGVINDLTLSEEEIEQLMQEGSGELSEENIRIALMLIIEELINAIDDSDQYDDDEEEDKVVLMKRKARKQYRADSPPIARKKRKREREKENNPQAYTVPLQSGDLRQPEKEGTDTAEVALPKDTVPPSGNNNPLTLNSLEKLAAAFDLSLSPPDRFVRTTAPSNAAQVVHFPEPPSQSDTRALRAAWRNANQRADTNRDAPPTREVAAPSDNQVTFAELLADFDPIKTLTLEELLRRLNHGDNSSQLIEAIKQRLAEYQGIASIEPLQDLLNDREYHEGTRALLRMRIRELVNECDNLKTAVELYLERSWGSSIRNILSEKILRLTGIQKHIAGTIYLFFSNAANTELNDILSQYMCLENEVVHVLGLLIGIQDRTVRKRIIEWLRINKPELDTTIASQIEKLEKELADYYQTPEEIQAFIASAPQEVKNIITEMYNTKDKDEFLEIIKQFAEQIDTNLLNEEAIEITMSALGNCLNSMSVTEIFYLYTAMNQQETKGAEVTRGMIKSIIIIKTVSIPRNVTSISALYYVINNETLCPNEDIKDLARRRMKHIIKNNQDIVALVDVYLSQEWDDEYWNNYLWYRIKALSTAKRLAEVNDRLLSEWSRNPRLPQKTKQAAAAQLSNSIASQGKISEIHLTVSSIEDGIERLTAISDRFKRQQAENNDKTQAQAIAQEMVSKWGGEALAALANLLSKKIHSEVEIYIIFGIIRQVFSLDIENLLRLLTDNSINKYTYGCKQIRGVIAEVLRKRLLGYNDLSNIPELYQMLNTYPNRNSRAPLVERITAIINESEDIEALVDLYKSQAEWAWGLGVVIQNRINALKPPQSCELMLVEDPMQKHSLYPQVLQGAAAMQVASEELPAWQAPVTTREPLLLDMPPAVKARREKLSEVTILLEGVITRTQALNRRQSNERTIQQTINKEQKQTRKNQKKISNLRNNLIVVQDKIQKLRNLLAADWETIEAYLKAEPDFVFEFFTNKIKAQIEGKEERTTEAGEVLGEILQRINIPKHDAETHNLIFAAVAYTVIAGYDVSKIIPIYIEKEQSYLINSGFNSHEILAAFIRLSFAIYRRDKKPLFNALCDVIKEYISRDFSNVNNVLELALKQDKETAMEIFYRMLTDIDDFLYQALTARTQDTNENIRFAIDGVFLADYLLRMEVYLRAVIQDENRLNEFHNLDSVGNLINEVMEKTVDGVSGEIIFSPEFTNAEKFLKHIFRQGTSFELMLLENITVRLNAFTSEDAFKKALELEFLGLFISQRNEDTDVFEKEREMIRSELTDLVTAVKGNNLMINANRRSLESMHRIIGRKYQELIQQQGLTPSNTTIDKLLSILVYFPRNVINEILNKTIMPQAAAGTFIFFDNIYTVRPDYRQTVLETVTKAVANAYTQEDNVQLMMLRPFFEQCLNAIHEKCRAEDRDIVKTIIQEIISDDESILEAKNIDPHISDSDMLLLHALYSLIVAPQERHTGYRVGINGSDTKLEKREIADLFEIERAI
ncbi:MAG: hypothetical protein ABH952_01585 [Candidatus Omnitrophota bacterium]